MRHLQIGWSQASITPEQPVYMGGQIYPRIAKYAHDPLTVSALAMEDDGAQAILVSLDIMCVPPKAVTDRIRAELSTLDGFDPANLSISATHTHNSIQDTPWLFMRDAIDFMGEERFGLPRKPDFMLEGRALNDFLIRQVAQTARDAWLSRKAGGIATASDYAAVAFNRRPVFRTEQGEETQMYGVCAQESFLRYEGGSDHSADMLFTFDDARVLTGVAVCIPCPSQVFELHSFLTADYWHYTRKALRERFGNIYILPLCGAAGDQNPLDLTRISKVNAPELRAWSAQAGEVLRNLDMADVCRDIADRIADAVARGYRKAKEQIDTRPVFCHETASMRLPIRKVTEQDYREAAATLEKEKAAFSAAKPMQGADLVRIFEPMGVYGRYLQQNRSPFVEANLHFWRFGRMAMVSCPFELFVDYAFRIKARAMCEQTVVLQMTDDYLDYLPTMQALAGGSYSSAPASTTCGPESGETFVEKAIDTLNRLWYSAQPDRH